MEINERLKELRLQNKMTQRELAKKLGISIPTLQKYEYGTLKIKNEIILSLCDIFKISTNVFFDKVETIDDIEKEEYRKKRALFIIEKIRKNRQKEREKRIIFLKGRKSDIYEKMDTFENFYYSEEQIEEPEFKKLFPLIQFLMLYLDLDIEIEDSKYFPPENVIIYNEYLKIKYTFSIKGFEKFLTLINDNMIHNFFSTLDYSCYNEFEEEEEDEYITYEEDEDEE